jgi:hypothetical protein
MCEKEEEEMAMYVELVGYLFEVDLGTPSSPARAWRWGEWIPHFLSNAEVLESPDAHVLQLQDVDGSAPVTSDLAVVAA